MKSGHHPISSISGPCQHFNLRHDKQLLVFGSIVSR